MFTFFAQYRRDMKTLALLRHVATRCSRGGHQRIDENRELLELMQARCPEYLALHPAVEGLLAPHDDFFTALAHVGAVENPHDERDRETPGHQFPRRWPGHPGSIRDGRLEGLS